MEKRRMLLPDFFFHLTDLDKIYCYNTIYIISAEYLLNEEA